MPPALVAAGIELPTGRVIDVAPAVTENAPLRVQVVVALGELAATSPVGKVSVKLRSRVADPRLLFVSVIVSKVDCGVAAFGVNVLGEKDLASVTHPQSRGCTFAVTSRSDVLR